MPSRRPFTDEGKRLGRLKLLVAGDSDTGKTALIKAIVQISDAIVHVDPIVPPPTVFGHRSSPRSKSKSKSVAKGSNATDQICEISASTKPYPEWWSDLDDSRLLKRRKSLGGDTILDRNVCFIDTPGYSGGLSSMESITPVVRYVESHLETVQSNTLSDPELLNMLGGDGGNQVDLVLYLIHNKLQPADINYLQLLSPLTNIIPLLARADTMSPETIRQSKERIRSELKDANVRPFSFTTSVHAQAAEPQWPYAVSSMPGSDHEIMDASLLMSPDYVQPLMNSDLGTLVDQIFSESGASWLRHAAAKKFLQWKNLDNHPTRPRGLYRPLSLQTGAGAAAAGASSTSLVAAATPPRTYMLARMADHTQREERMAEIRLANWASDLQRSLANERARYEALARGERAVWLTEKLNECVQEGTLVPVHGRDHSDKSSRPSLSSRSVRSSKPGRLPRDWKQDNSTLPHHDPLGLLEVTTRLRNSGWIALEVVGGVGILGGAVFWFSKSHAWHVQTIAWAFESWSAFWDSDR
ncbi:Septin-domain-containing protein [Coniella lustricola]|uniref:Septin-domain-containing protein n=1 Tax=Coniella lustricola TaxID=2025994 RepID=A0A2T2ZWZ7_9PEZI|nr:Septin-domain-containing protein [Coniella lustricola]